ncbi:type IV pilus biogenesis protein PilP [Stenotrophomonas maltophilia]|jgi:type IV pilus biogenesis protein PilP|uniref:type IV pilus biogenesis protein PilP n=1 Tax=Stenotrophomonas maltophilia TaxID=40324 RepID=UPI0009AC9285|nr:type IV pilus biogenesis protein PilP [Stenotrophomonas maltophilia]
MAGNKLRALWVGATFLIAIHASASESSAPPSAARLADLQAQLVIARAEAALAEQRRKTTGDTSTVDLAVQATGSALPVVSGVYGRDKNLYATLLYSNGLEWQAIAGTSAPGGYRVHSVSQNRVELVKEGRTFVLGFSGSPPAEPTPVPAAQPAGGPAPYLPLPGQMRN